MENMKFGQIVAGTRVFYQRTIILFISSILTLNQKTRMVNLGKQLFLGSLQSNVEYDFSFYIQLL